MCFMIHTAIIGIHIVFGSSYIFGSSYDVKLCIHTTKVIHMKSFSYAASANFEKDVWIHIIGWFWWKISTNRACRAYF